MAVYYNIDFRTKYDYIGPGLPPICCSDDNGSMTIWVGTGAVTLTGGERKLGMDRKGDGNVRTVFENPSSTRHTLHTEIDAFHFQRTKINQD